MKGEPAAAHSSLVFHVIPPLLACLSAELTNLGTMSAVISITKSGTLTLPKKFWMQRGLQSSGRVVAQETKDGVLLRAETVPVAQTYSEAKVARIAKAEAALARFADDMRASLLKTGTRR